MQGVASYKNLESKEDTAVFVASHSALIRKIACYIKRTVPSYLELDDLLHSGLVGLLEARNAFKEDGGASFQTYASLKIRCAIYEGIRKSSGITREISQNIKKITELLQQKEQEGASRPSVTTMAEGLGVSVKKYSDITRQINTYQSINVYDNSMLEETASGHEADPLNRLEVEDAQLTIKRVLQQFPKREQMILALYYNEQMNFKEIASILDLTEARVSQLHTQTITKLKRKLTCNAEALV